MSDETREATKTVPDWADTEAEPVKPVKRLVDVRIEAEPPYGWYYRPPDLAKQAARLEEWVAAFHDFIRDHRSQDPVSLRVERVHETQCSGCGSVWETDSGFCASCESPVAQDEEGKP